MGDETKGVFKRFEYLSLPFSITGNKEKFSKLLQNAEENGTSFREELDKDATAKRIVEQFFDVMDSHPAFSRQALDHSLGKSYIDVTMLAEAGKEDTFEDHLAKVVTGWKHLADFYCIEGLVGGDGKRNPFTKNENSSLLAGALDSLESTLPRLKQKVNSETWKEICLKLSLVVGRDYKQIDRAVEVLGLVFRTEKEISEDEAQQSLNLIGELSSSTFETNTDIGKLYNTLIRFHNWMPLALKQNGPSGDTYDSICVPSKKALELLEESSEIKKSISQIRDATSPKGLALATLVDDEKIGSKEKLISRIKDRGEELLEKVDEGREQFTTFSLGDPAFYTGLTGGKWKGLKLLHDAKEAFELTYKVPEGFAVSSIALEKMFKEGLEGILKTDIFSLNEERRGDVLKILDSIDFEKCISREMLDPLGDSLIVRSSMYGEDGSSNFSGTYESAACKRENLGEAITEVVKSYFYQEAINSREDVGLAHIPGISLVIQQKIKGKGGVIHLTKCDCSVSFAETPEDAVLGKGSHKSAGTMDEALEGTPLQILKNDFRLLHKVFGDSDLEFVIDNRASIYLTQLRPKYRTPEHVSINSNTERMTISSLDDLPNTVLNRKYIVTMEFLGRDNIINREGEIMDFIRKNRLYIVAVEGNMPRVAHIPNKIEGHFKIPYLMRGIKNDK